MDALVEGEARLSAVERIVRVAKGARPADPRPDEIDSADEHVVAGDYAAHECALKVLEHFAEARVIRQRRQGAEARASRDAGPPAVAGDLEMPGRGQRRSDQRLGRRFLGRQVRGDRRRRAECGGENKRPGIFQHSPRPKPRDRPPLPPAGPLRVAGLATRNRSDSNPIDSIEGNGAAGNSAAQSPQAVAALRPWRCSRFMGTSNRLANHPDLAPADLNQHRQNEIRREEARARLIAGDERDHRLAVGARHHRAVARRKLSRNRRNGDVERAHELELLGRELRQPRHRADLGDGHAFGRVGRQPLRKNSCLLAALPASSDLERASSPVCERQIR